MAREQRKDVDYFPHDCVHGRKMHIIESRHGNDGYATWFKVLEELGKANNHYIDLSDDSAFMYLASICRVEEEKLKLILNDLAKLNAIDGPMYENHRIIWSQKFADSIQDAYRNRRSKIFQYSDILNEISLKNGQSSARLTHNGVNLTEVIPKEEKSKVKKSKEELSSSTNSPPPEIDFKKLIDFFNDNRGNMPEIKIISPARKTRIKNLIANHKKESLQHVIEKSKKSKFMQGENDRNWVADFDWITKSANFIKILEGNYDNDRIAPRTNATAGFEKNR